MRVVVLAIAAVLCWGAEPEPHIYPASQLVVTDGDTVKARLDLGMRLSVDTAVRVTGVDAPESRGATAETGKAVTAVTSAWLKTRKRVYARLVCEDKYGGRVVADFLDENGNRLSVFLVEKRLVHVYLGDTKTPFSAEELKTITATAAAVEKELLAAVQKP